MNNSILVTISKSGDYFGISTYSREHKKHGRFLVEATKIFSTMSDQNCAFIDTDCGHYLKCKYRPVTKTLHFEITWLNYGAHDNVNGFIQRFVVPSRYFNAAFFDPQSRSFKYLHSEKPIRRCVKTATGSTLNCILDDKFKKRAFSKAMRDFFKNGWGDIELYKDGLNGNLYFEESFMNSNGRGICGGLILNKRAFHRNGATRVMYHYSMHT